MAEYEGRDAVADQRRNEASSVQLTSKPQRGRRLFVGPEAVRCVDALINLIQPLVEERYRRFICRDHLIALQPNDHNDEVNQHSFTVWHFMIIPIPIQLIIL